jgi:hypothetical protein
MIRSFVLVAALLGAGMAQAQATPEKVEALIKAIAENGCEVTPDNNAAILAAAGLGDDDAQAVVATLLGLGSATIEDGKLRLKTAGCE